MANQLPLGVATYLSLSMRFSEIQVTPPPVSLLINPSPPPSHPSHLLTPVHPPPLGDLDPLWSSPPNPKANASTRLTPTTTPPTASISQPQLTTAKLATRRSFESNSTDVICLCFSLQFRVSRELHKNLLFKRISVKLLFCRKFWGILIPIFSFFF